MRLRFRVYPENRSLYYICHVFPSVRAMRRFVARARSGRNKETWHRSEMVSARKALGMVHHCDRIDYRQRRARKHPQVGLILLAKRHLGGGVVSHEAAHAARYYFQRLGVPFEQNRHDERFAWALGNIVAQIGRRVWA